MNAFSRAHKFLLLTIFMFFSMNINAALITTSIDRDPVNFGESFRLTFESSDSVDDDPDFSPLQKDFQIISNNVSSNMRIINGSISSSKKWQLVVLPNRPGTLRIPSISFGRDKSQAMTVTVAKGQGRKNNNRANQDVFLEVAVKPDQPYVQSQIVYTVRLYRSINTANASLTEPQISGVNAVIDKIGEDRNYELTVRGKRYAVVERNYAIYPQASGIMTISSLTFRGQPSRGSFFSFDPFGPQPDTHTSNDKYSAKLDFLN